MTNWKKYKWGSVASLEYGKGVRDFKTSIGNIPVYGTNGPIGFTTEILCPYPSIIIGRKGAYRGVHYSPTPFFVIDTAFYLKPKNQNIDLKFAYYNLLLQDINGLDSGSAIPSTRREDFYELEINLPDLPTQTRIASILSSLDDKIELNRRMNQTLEQMAQALFNHYFVSNIDPDNLPEGWNETTLKHLGNIVCGKTPLKAVAENFNGIVPFIKIPDMHNLPFILKTQDTLTNKGANSQKNKFIPEGSICVSCIATVGLVSIATKPSQTNQQINSIVSAKSFYKYFLYFSLKGLREHLKMLGGGGTMTLNVNTTLFSNIGLIKPVDEKITAFDKLVTPMMELVLNNLIENEKLVKIKDTLLPKLMSGEIDVNGLNDEEGIIKKHEVIETM